MSDVHTMYEDLIRSIGRNMPSLVASLVPDDAAPTAAQDTNEAPMKEHGKRLSDAE